MLKAALGMYGNLKDTGGALVNVLVLQRGVHAGRGKEQRRKGGQESWQG